MDSAASGGGGHGDIAELLMTENANLYAEPAWVNGRTALLAAAEHEDDDYELAETCMTA